MARTNSQIPLRLTALPANHDPKGARPQSEELGWKMDVPITDAWKSQTRLLIEARVRDSLEIQPIEAEVDLPDPEALKKLFRTAQMKHSRREQKSDKKRIFFHTRYHPKNTRPADIQKL